PVLFLRSLEVGDGLVERSALAASFAELSQHRRAAGRYVRGRRVEQCAVIGKRNLIQVVVVVIEGAPPAVTALHADDPLAPARDRLAILITIRSSAADRTIHSHHDNRRVVGIGIVRIGVLKCPTTWANAGSR